MSSESTSTTAKPSKKNAKTKSDEAPKESRVSAQNNLSIKEFVEKNKNLLSLEKSTEVSQVYLK